VERVNPTLRALIGELINGTKQWPLLLLGEVDTGKTRAALCLGDSVGGWYLELPSLCRMLIAAGKGELQWSTGYKRSQGEIWTAIQTTCLIILDEIGTKNNTTDNHYEVTKGVLDLRAGRPAVYISNLDIDGIEEVYDDRVASRISCGTVFELTGPDRRIEKGDAV
jgi:DNA replication protein DnaC